MFDSQRERTSLFSPAMQKCPGCDKRFHTDRGLKIHIGHKHKNLANILKENSRAPPPTSNDDQGDLDLRPSLTTDSHDTEDTIATNSVPSTSICAVCHKSFPSSHSLAIHFSSHPIEANQARVDRHRVQPVNAPEQNNDPQSNHILPSDLSSELDKWFKIFEKTSSTLTDFDVNKFNLDVEAFQKFLYKATDKTPGPVHPATTYYRLRQKRQATNTGTSIARTSNPQRKDTNARRRRRAKYEFDLAQFQYHYQRRKVARRVLDGETASTCKIPMPNLEKHFKSVFENSNDCIREQYDQPNSVNDDVSISVEEVKEAIAKIKTDTSSGSDRVLMKTVKDLGIAHTLQCIITTMLATGAVPQSLCKGRTILIPKDGDSKDPKNWRPICIYSVLRRIIERLLDSKLRLQLDFNSNQRGFMTGTPGCAINSALVNSCLVKAKSLNKDCVVVFLDLTKAFDRVGHDHIERTLQSKGVSPNLQRLVMAFMKNNKMHLEAGRTHSEPIEVRRSVPQGGPMSPTLFNLATDFLFQEICEPEFANSFGFKLSDSFDSLILTGFADDVAITTDSIAKASRIVDLAQSLYNSIGLDINPRKSSAIHIKNGKLISGELTLSNGVTIDCIGPNDKVRYLGCSYNSELVFDETVVDKLTNNMNRLIASPLVTPNQKLNLLNQYLFPRLTYPLQSAPLRKIPSSSLETLDKNIRATAKAIIGLPTSTATASIYAPRKYRGLGLVCCAWEAYLQHYAISSKLSSSPDRLFHDVFDCEQEMRVCCEQLGVNGTTTRQLRAALREGELDRWAAMPYQGVGVQHYREYPKANSFIYEKKLLSGSEWTASIKLCTGYANLVGVPGVQSIGGSASILCRRCLRERETPSHVLGACPFGELMRNNRHHKVKFTLADMLKEKGFHCMIEAHCLDGDGRNRFVDILAIKPGHNTAYIIDPTIRWESNGDVGNEVQIEKRNIYESCFDDLRLKYPIIGNRECEVVGLWFGARGVISRQVVDFFNKVGLETKALPDLAESILMASINMIARHIHG